MVVSSCGEAFDCLSLVYRAYFCEYLGVKATNEKEENELRKGKKEKKTKESEEKIFCCRTFVLIRSSIRYGKFLNVFFFLLRAWFCMESSHTLYAKFDCYRVNNAVQIYWVD